MQAPLSGAFLLVSHREQRRNGVHGSCTDMHGCSYFDLTSETQKRFLVSQAYVKFFSYIRDLNGGRTRDRTLDLSRVKGGGGANQSR